MAVRTLTIVAGAPSTMGHRPERGRLAEGINSAPLSQVIRQPCVGSSMMHHYQPSSLTFQKPSGPRKAMSMAGAVPGDMWVRQDRAHLLHKCVSSFQPQGVCPAPPLQNSYSKSILTAATGLAILSHVFKAQGLALLPAF